MGKGSITIKEMAKMLGVSKSTVSRALRGSDEIGEETKQRVLELARTVNYFPNPIALSLVGNRSNTIGVIVPDIANPFFSSVIGGVEEVAYSRGYHVMIYQSHDTYERERIDSRHISARHADGLIISIASHSPNFDHLRALQENGIPVVLFDRSTDEIQTHKVQVDDYKGAFEATEHLAIQGCRKIAHIAGPLNLSISRDRLRGYRDVLNKYDLPYREEWVIQGEYNQEVGSERAYQLMALRERPDAIFAASDRIAIGVHVALRQLGYRMPDDVALIGFSDLPVSALLDPPLSTVVQPTKEMGQQAAELLLSLLEIKKPPAQFETKVLQSKLVVRKSSLKLQHSLAD